MPGCRVVTNLLHTESRLAVAPGESPDLRGIGLVKKLREVPGNVTGATPPYTDMPQVIVLPFKLELPAKRTVNGMHACGITPLSNHPTYPKVTIEAKADPLVSVTLCLQCISFMLTTYNRVPGDCF